MHVADRKQEPDLGADAKHLRLEAANTVAGAAVAADLLIDIAHEANHDLLRQELRCTPVEVQVDAALILRRSIFEIVGDAEHPRKFVAGLRIEIGVTAAGVDRAVSDANIRQVRGLVGANRDVAGDVGHEVVDAGVPFQLEHRRQIPKAPCRIADVVEPRPEGSAAEWRHRGHAGQGPCQAGADDAIGCYQGHRRLAAEYRCLEYIGRDHKAKIADGVDIQV